MTLIKGLSVVTLTPGCGYGDAGCQYLSGLNALGVPISWRPTIANTPELLAFEMSKQLIPAVISDDVLGLWQKEIECDTILVDLPPAHLHHYWRDEKPDWRAFTYIAWELETVPDEWIPALDRYERVFVPSKFNQSALLEAGVSAAVDVIPHIAREVVPVSSEGQWGDLRDDDFAFYTIGSWTTRKAMELTLRTFLDTFTSDDPVALIIKTEPVNQPVYSQLSKAERRDNRSLKSLVWWAVARILSSYSNPPKVHLIAEGVSATEIDRLHTRGDCFISLTHSEGWGLGPFDAALFGNPVIITGWGGQTDYLGADYPFLIDYEMRSTSLSQPDGYFLHTEGALWAHADEAHAQQLMRQVVSERKEARQMAQGLQSRLQKKYAPEVVCSRLATLMGFDVSQPDP